MAVVTAVMGAAFLLGRPLDEGERAFGLLTAIGIAVALFFAYLASVGAELMMKRTQPQAASTPGPEPLEHETVAELLVPCPECGARNRLAALPARNVTLRCGSCRSEFRYGSR